MAVLKQLERQTFDKENQCHYQILLIQAKLYKPENLPINFERLFEDTDPQSISYDKAREMFELTNYKDPPMRGRQSVNPLNKLGFAVAKAGVGPIRITELGNQFLTQPENISHIFFKSFLKLQFPNPWSKAFSAKRGFNIVPFVSTLHLLTRINNISKHKGLNKDEFCLFVPTLINFADIDSQIKLILDFRRSKDKKKFTDEFLKNFYDLPSLTRKHIKRPFEYGDNILRCFRLTRYFHVSSDPMGQDCFIDIEPARETEIAQLIQMYDGSAKDFKNWSEYIDYLSDIAKPELPWEKLDNLKTIAKSWQNTIKLYIAEYKISVNQEESNLLRKSFDKMTREEIEAYISTLQQFNALLRTRVKKSLLMRNRKKLIEIIQCLRSRKQIKKYSPEQFEKLIGEALLVLNDEINIKLNYISDDEGEPINHAPPNKTDIECYYQSFNSICEVTLDCSKLQWVRETVPVMRHLRNFELQYSQQPVFCLFVAPVIHNDTFAQFWMAVKYEYDGNKQQIIPMTTDLFADFLEVFLKLIEKKKEFSHKDILGLYERITSVRDTISSFSDWAKYIPQVICKWREEITSKYAV